MPKRFYVGPVDEVAVRVDGREVVVKRGDAVDVTHATAAQLDAVGTYLHVDPDTGTSERRHVGDPIWVSQDPTKPAAKAAKEGDR